MTLAKGWLEECSTSHKVCHRKLNKEEMPTRVLDVATSAIKLACTSIVDIDRYATLSYKWGSNPQLQTNLDTLSNHETKIGWLTLSKTTQDAIKVTRKLGLKYLWVDALCIIQDSPDDKPRELRKMASIYKNAAVTIIAQAAESAHDGFAISPKWPLIDLTINFGLADNRGILFLRRRENLTHIADYNIEATESRAWCLQESLLSRATLVFGSMQMFWSCCEIYHADQTGSYSKPNGKDPSRPFPTHVHHIANKLPAVLLQQSASVELTVSEREEIWEFWTRVVNLYGAREVTYFTDRFDAISAIVSEIQKFTLDDFVAGLWSPNMARGLLWCVDPTLGTSPVGKRFPRPSQSIPEDAAAYIAPTWSWLSVLGSVTYRSLLPSPDCKIMSYDIQHVDPAQPLGRLRGGTITVQGRLNLAVWVRKRRTTNAGNGGLWRLDLPSRWSARQVIAEQNRIDRGKARSGAHRWNAGMDHASGFGAFTQPSSGWGRAASPFGGQNVPQPQPYGPSNPVPAYSCPMFPQQEQGRSWADSDRYINSRGAWPKNVDEETQEVWCLEVAEGAGLLLEAPENDGGYFCRVGFWEGKDLVAGAKVEKVLIG
ncbi:hypothetical protein MMC11_003417 [Xylographa trunciseda]|nr:hypothetical protein [Xylographa trunciseda]